MRCFSVRIEKSSKKFKIQPKTCKKSHIFKDFSILTEKQRMKPKNLNSWKNFASFDTLIVIESAKVVEIKIISKIVSLAMILKSNNPMEIEISSKIVSFTMIFRSNTPLCILPFCRKNYC